MNEKTIKKNVPARLCNKQIIPYVQDQMASDDDGNDKQSIRIQQIYENANDLQKQLIDDVFAALCGWSMKSIITQADPIEEDEDEEDN